MDLVTILDRTGSMDGGDMENAKDGVRTLLEYFSPELQRVGLGVLPGGRTSPPDPCDAPPTYPEPAEDDYAIYLPVGLSDDYQNTDGTLNESSSLVSTILCLEAGGQTNIGSPMAAAIGELQTNGRPGEKWGIILLSDGAANRPVGGDTGNLSPTANAAVTSGSGDNDGFQTDPAGAYADDSSGAEDPNSGTSTSTSCGDAGKDRHDFYNYGISVPGTSSVVGIEVRLDARIDSTSASTRRMCVQLSWDGGATWTAAQQTPNLSSSYQTYILGGSSSTWGRSWTPSELSNANFRVRITDVASNASRDFYLDWAAVKVYYASADGPCQYAANQADIAKSLGIEIFTIGYGLHDPNNPGGNYCYNETGAWADRPGWELLEYMATDSDHFFDQPSTADLRRIFEIIAATIIPIAGEDVTVIEVLPSYVHFVVNSATIDGVGGPASQPAISDAGHTLTWELGLMTISDAHHISFQVTFDSPGDDLLADVYPNSHVEFVDYLSQAQTRPFPETWVDIPVCSAVGGTVKLRRAPADHSGLYSRTEGPPYVPLAALSAVALLALTVGAWHVRRRWLTRPSSRR